MKKRIVAALAALALTFPALAQEKAEIGGKLVDVEVFDVEGGMSYLENFVNQDGKYLLVNFWTANCPRCHAGFVELAKYTQKYADKLNVVGVMLSDNYNGWVEMYKYKKPFAWPNLSDGQPLATGAAVPYGITLYPMYVLVDQQGTILAKWSGFQLDKFQEQLKPWFAPVTE